MGGLGNDYSYSLRLRGGMPESINSFKNAVNQIFECSDLLAKNKTRILCTDWENTINWATSYKKKVFYYFDPPYLHETRVSDNLYGNFEMTFEEHQLLLEACLKLKAEGHYVMLSGYKNDLYDLVLKGWRKFSFPMKSAAGVSDKKITKIETVWLSY